MDKVFNKWMVIREWKDGKNVGQIARKFNVNSTIVYDIVEEYETKKEKE